jgi:hypothetical protein
LRRKAWISRHIWPAEIESRLYKNINILMMSNEVEMVKLLDWMNSLLTFKPMLYFTTKLILWNQYYSDTKIRCYHNKKANKRPIFFVNLEANILNKILRKQIQQQIKTHFMSSMQGEFKMHKPVNALVHRKRIKDKYHIRI